jgi:hypothetical protein
MLLAGVSADCLRIAGNLEVSENLDERVIAEYQIQRRLPAMQYSAEAGLGSDGSESEQPFE